MRLKVNAIRLEAAHAAYDWEQRLGTTLEVDVDVSYRKHPKGDRMTGVVAVEDVVGAVHRVSGKKTYRVIESLASDILDAIWKAHAAKLAGLRVCVRKILPKSDRRIAGYEVEVRREK